MIYELKGNLLASSCDYICHQVNCQGKMGSGVAKQIRDRWPEVYSNYIRVANSKMLGKVQILYIEDANIPFQCVVNMFAQEFYGYNGNRYTSYDAFWNCLNELKNKIPKGATVAFPYKIGCGLGGANWQVIRTMIEEVLGDEFDVYIYEL